MWWWFAFGHGAKLKNIRISWPWAKIKNEGNEGNEVRERNYEMEQQERSSMKVKDRGLAWNETKRPIVKSKNLPKFNPVVL